MAYDLFKKSGLLSRFDVVLTPKEYIPQNIDYKDPVLPQELLDRLVDTLKLPKDYGEGTYVKREPQSLEWESEALMRRWHEWRNEIGRNSHSIDMAIIEEDSESQTLNRLAEKAVRYAAIHALGCNRMTITEEDLNFGIAFVSRIRDEIMEYLRAHGAKDKAEEFRKKLLLFMEKNPNGTTKSAIAKSLYRFPKLTIRNPVIEDLIMAGVIVEIIVTTKANESQDGLSKYFLAVRPEKP